MNKKYLSVILFGALMLGTTGTFTSCKDYDDDINNLQSQVDGIKTTLAELQKAIENGKYVTSIVAEGNGLKITMNDGTSNVIENVINGETPKPGDVVTFDAETGEILINGEKTGYYASKDAETEKFKAPYVNDEGILVLIDEEGEEVVTGIRVAPVTAVQNADLSYTLTIWGADGKSQTVLIPSFASAITGIDILKDNAISHDNQELKINYWVHANAVTWKGPRGNIAAKTILYSAAANDAKIDFKLSPASIDGTGVSFALINSNDSYAPVKLTSPANNKNLVTKATTYYNGLYATAVGEKSEVYTYTSAATDFTNQFEKNGKSILFALTPLVEGTNVRSPYQIWSSPTALTTATLQSVTIKGVDENAASKNYTTALEGNGTATIKVGVEASLSVDKPDFLYDMYMTVTESAQNKFGLVVDNEAKTIEATKSPDDLTDATFDLTVYVMDNAGKAYDKTVITVTVNRTMATSAYDKQVKELTKLKELITVSATGLFNSLDNVVDDWKESVDLSKTNFALLEKNAAGDYVTATEDVNNFIANGNVATALDQNGNANGGVAFLTSDNKIATPSNLANIRFSFNIPQAAANKPVKIGKEYYIRLTFRSKDNIVLNTIVVPFELTKPELSTILVKESGVFRDGDDLAYAYMYWKDADTYDAETGKVDLTEVASSQYYIDRAFTDMIAKLEKAGMDATAFTVSTTDKLIGNDPSSTFAKGDDNGDRRYIKLTKTDQYGNYYGYKQDLNVIFEDKYLGVNDASYNYKHTYKFRIMSPILEGEAIAANNLVEVSATGRTKLYKEDIWAKTYNNDVKYDIFRKAEGTWYRDDIKDVTFSSGNVNVFEVTVATPTDPQAAKDENPAVPSYIEVEGVSENTSKLNVAIKDIWGYTLEDQVDIKTTLNLGE